jgi:hypothetical protein
LLSRLRLLWPWGVFRFLSRLRLLWPWGVIVVQLCGSVIVTLVPRPFSEATAIVP